MKTVLRSLVVAILLLSGGLAAQAQNLAGQWQGTLQAGQELRIVFMLTPNAAAGGYTAMMYSIDQGAMGVAATATVQGSTVRLAVVPAGITFEGKLAADGNSIAGTFTQGPGSLPVTFTRATKETAWALPAPPKSMASDAPTVFELATIKPSDPDRQGRGITMRGRELLTINTPLGYLIEFAYSVNTRQVIGGPSWMASDRYDIVGRPQAEGVPNDRQIRAMIRTLLEQRFQLAIHREKRELPAYALVVGNAGPKMTKNETNPNGLPGLGFKGLGSLAVVNANMSDFVNLLQSNVLDRPVVDRTALEGRFDFTLNWTPDESQFRGMGIQVPPPAADAKLPSLFTAIQEQLGLKLDSTNAPVEVIVIDKVEKPSEN